MADFADATSSELERKARALQWICVTEALSYSVLLYFMLTRNDIGRAVMGSVHGVVVLAFAAMVIMITPAMRWSWWYVVVVLLTGPIGAILVYERIRRHEESLARRFLAAIDSIDGLRLHGLADPQAVADRTPTFLIEIDGRSPREVAAALGERGMFAWDGDFYAPGPLRRLGLGPQGGVRIGFLHYNTAAEVDALIEALTKIATEPAARLTVSG